MRRVLPLLLFVTAVASAAFLGSNPQRKVVAVASSVSDTLKNGGTQVLITVTGGSNLTGAFVTLATNFPCTARRDTAATSNASFFVVKGVPVVRARPAGAVCFAVISATSDTATVRFETGSGAP